MRCILLVVLCTLFHSPLFVHSQNPDGPTVQSPHVTVSLVADREVVVPGENTYIGFHFRLDPGWHVYWKNPGDSGSAPKFTLAPSGTYEVGDLIWPTPQRIRAGPLLNYGYETEALLLVPLKASSSLESEGTLDIRAQGEWLVCQEECIPGEGTFRLTVPLASRQSAGTARSSLFERALASIPKSASAQGTILYQPESISVNLEGLGQLETPALLPETPGIIENAAPQIVERRGDGAYTFVLKRAAARKSPADLRAVIIDESKPLTAPGTAIVAHATSSGSASTASSSASLLLAILGAFAGGLILNLMPCVLPVIGIKLFALLEQKQQAPRVARRHALAFAAGILVSMWILCAISIAFYQAGQSSGWGFQLQEPWVVSSLALLFFLLGLNLLGVAEFGARLQALAGTVKTSPRYSGSFLAGVLTTVVATPCTAPFMGASVAVALSSGPRVAVAIFTSLAIGLSLPFLSLAYFPAALRMLPKPGAWMVTLKGFMAFPMFAASLWLLYVLGLQTGNTGTIVTLEAALLSGFALWVFNLGAAPRASRTRRRLSAGVSLALLVPAFYMTATIPAAPANTNAGDSIVDNFGLHWRSWSPETLASLQGEQKTIYVDFTAAWCITCQVNKRVVFGSEAVRRALDEHAVVLLRADWTNKDPVIRAALEAHGRAGVPLNLLYRAGKEPLVFPALMTPGMLLDALTP